MLGDLFSNISKDIVRNLIFQVNGTLETNVWLLTAGRSEFQEMPVNPNSVDHFFKINILINLKIQFYIRILVMQYPRY